MQAAAIAPIKLQIVGRLHQHIIEFKEGEGLLALEPQLDTVKGQHAIDGEMHAIIAQEIDIAELFEPVGIVDHDGVVGMIAKGQELAKGCLDAGHIGRYLGIGQQGALLILIGWIANLGRTAAHQGNRPMAGLLQPA